MNELRITRYKDIEDTKNVVYWIQNAYRISYNHALEYALYLAQTNHGKVIIYMNKQLPFFINESQGIKMKEAIKKLAILYQKLDFQVVVSNDDRYEDMLALDCTIITDQAYYRENRKLLSHLVQQSKQSFYEVDTNLMVPVTIASNKEEYSAATFRKKYDRKMTYYKDFCPLIEKQRTKIDDLNQLLVSEEYTALLQFKAFIDQDLPLYHLNRNNPSHDVTSHLSYALHFGFVSPLELYERLTELKQSTKQPQIIASIDDYIEQLLIRREVAYNYIYYQPLYDQVSGLPHWCQQTLMEHNEDLREYHYTLTEFENAVTHDPYWNAAMNQLKKEGYIHNYMRMYWGKKIIEWTEHYPLAFEIALELNNKYALDGFDANSFTGVAWCFGKHDRPWTNRPIFGMIRYMNQQGLLRKFNLDPYLTMYQEK